MPYKWDFTDTIGAEYNTVVIRPMSEYDPSFFEADPHYKEWVTEEFEKLTDGFSNEQIFEILVGAVERQRELDDDTNDYYVRECVASIAELRGLSIGGIIVKADEHHRRMTYASYEAQDFIYDNWHLFIPYTDIINGVVCS